MDTTDAGGEATGQPRGQRGPTRTGLVGALIGVGAAAGGLLLLTGGAGAQAAGADDASTTGLSTAVAVEGDAELEAGLESYIACVDEVLAGAGIDVEDDGESEIDLSEADWEAIDADVAGCDTLLPDEIATEWAELDDAFADYEACLTDHGFIGELVDEGDDEEGDLEGMEYGAFVLVDGEDGSTAIEFGEGDGTITLTKVDGDIAVATEGDVAVEELDWDDLEGLEDCDEHLDDIEGFDDLDDLFGDDDEEYGDDEEYEESEGDED